ncbi:MAG: TIGR04282 family arsenosugar biosynthesis glycosyltransferase [Rubrivivax sp.]|nr:TIGR04282 family arsenosugar biosynthesis glycosyltransferase [Rubrivivax sp.]
MAKAPVPGLAKTRLVPALGAEGAARLAARFLAHTLQEALAAGCGPVALSCAPDARHPAFSAWAADPRLTLEDQATGDLGERMATAFENAFARAPAVLLFGTDAPALDAALLVRAAAALERHDAVFAPTLDGGYVLAGLARRHRPRAWDALFRDMPWSTADVMQRTRQRLAGLGVQGLELPPLADVDEPADLVHVPPGWV